MLRGISVHTYSGYVHIWSFTPYVWTLKELFDKYNILYIMITYSQACQDLFVKHVKQSMYNGYFVGIGSNHPITHNNTYMLESIYNWKGLMVEYDASFEELYRIHRKNSIYHIDDARHVNYRDILYNNSFPHNIDYLQIDLDVNNRSTLDTLSLLNDTVFDTYKFATVTFEHDIYTGNYFTPFYISNADLYKIEIKLK